MSFHLFKHIFQSNYVAAGLAGGYMQSVSPSVPAYLAFSVKTAAGASDIVGRLRGGIVDDGVRAADSDHGIRAGRLRCLPIRKDGQSFGGQQLPALRSVSALRGYRDGDDGGNIARIGRPVPVILEQDADEFPPGERRGGDQYGDGRP